MVRLAKLVNGELSIRVNEGLPLSVVVNDATHTDTQVCKFCGFVACITVRHFAHDDCVCSWDKALCAQHDVAAFGVARPCRSPDSVSHKIDGANITAFAIDARRPIWPDGDTTPTFFWIVETIP